MTRRNVEIVSRATGDVHWTVLASEAPSPMLSALFSSVGLEVRQPEPKPVRYTGPLYSRTDPEQSVIAARQAATTADTARNRVLTLLLDMHGLWVEKEALRKVGGDSADRRARELRNQGGWPIGIRQPVNGQGTWAYRMVLPR